MEKIQRKYRILKRDWRKSNPDILEDSDYSKENNISYVKLGSLEKSQSSSLDGEEEIPERRLRPESARNSASSNLEGFDLLDDATADMMAMFNRNIGLDSQCSSARSSIKSILFDTDNSDDDEPEPDQFEEELTLNFPGYERFSMFVGQNDESRLSMLTPAGRILSKFRASLETAVELATGLQDEDPVKLELLQALHHHLCILKEDVTDNMKQTLLSTISHPPGAKQDLHTISEDFEGKSEYE